MVNIGANDDADMLLCHRLVELAQDAGREIMRFYGSGVEVEKKNDDTPVTEADRRGEEIILAGLIQACPEIPVVAEEAASRGQVPDDTSGEFFLVDPLDGTREFISRRGEFTVNIALVRNGVPAAGVVYAPALHEIYAGCGGRAWRADTGQDHRSGETVPITVRTRPSPPRIVASRSHRTPQTDTFIGQYRDAELVSIGSSLKFCLLAAGKADIYPRFGRTMEWDTAAGDAVLRAAGGSTTLPDGRPLCYGKRNQADDVDFANPHFIAQGGC